MGRESKVLISRDYSMSLMVVVRRMKGVGRKEGKKKDVVQRIAVMGRDVVTGMGRKEGEEVGIHILVVEVVGMRRAGPGPTAILTPRGIVTEMMGEEKRCGTMTLISLASHPTTITTRTPTEEVTTTKTKTNPTEIKITTTEIQIKTITTETKAMMEDKRADTTDSTQTISGNEQILRF